MRAKNQSMPACFDPMWFSFGSTTLEKGRKAAADVVGGVSTPSWNHLGEPKIRSALASPTNRANGEPPAPYVGGQPGRSPKDEAPVPWSRGPFEVPTTVPTP